MKILAQLITAGITGFMFTPALGAVLWRITQ